MTWSSLRLLGCRIRSKSKWQFKDDLHPSSIAPQHPSPPRPLTSLIHSSHPRRHRFLGQNEPLGGLRSRPATGCPQLEDSHPLDGPVVRSSAWVEACPSGVLDRQLLLQQIQFGTEPIDLSSLSDPGITARSRSCPGLRQCRGRQRDRVEHGGIEHLGPASWQVNGR